MGLGMMAWRMIVFSYDEFVSAGTDGGYALAGAYRSGGEFVHDWALDLLKRYWYS
jgi:hypothetical protein